VAIQYSLPDAVSLVRHVIQEHADEHYVLGNSARMDKIAWLATLLGWEFPQCYLDFISIYDGVFVGLDMVLSSDEAFDILSIFRDRWHKPDGYWPVGSDGCGDYWAMSIRQQETHPPGTVFFYDHEFTEDASRLRDFFAPDYASFVAALMRRSCEEHECNWPDSTRV
jgi:hypothetical protein